MSVMANLLCFGCFAVITRTWVLFSYQRFIFLLACIDCWKVYNRLVSACTVKTAIEVKCSCVSTSKKRHLCRASSFLTVVFLFACAAINWDKSAFRTTIIEDTHLTLAVILFKVEANNSWIFCYCKHTRKKLPSFVSVHIYNSLFHCWDKHC